MIKAFTIHSQFHFPNHPKSKSPNPLPKSINLIPKSNSSKPKTLTIQIPQTPSSNSTNGHFSSKHLITGAVSLGVVALVLLGIDGQRALAWGPEGPLVEEFWENVRRYGLYALTVSTGVLYAVFEPIVELLKNPISALLVIVILVGSLYIGSQVLSAMVGNSDFSYEYAY